MRVTRRVARVHLHVTLVRHVFAVRVRVSTSVTV